MRITESQLLRIIRQEVQALREISSPYGLYNEVDPVPGVRGTWRDRSGVELTGTVVRTPGGLGFQPDPAATSSAQRVGLADLEADGFAPLEEPLELVDPDTGVQYFNPDSETELGYAMGRGSRARR